MMCGCDDTVFSRPSSKPQRTAPSAASSVADIINNFVVIAQPCLFRISKIPITFREEPQKTQQKVWMEMIEMITV